MKRLWPILAVMLMVGLWGPTAARASSLQVSPIRATLTAAQPVMAIYVTNDGDAPVLIQASVQQWTQDEGEDIYAPTRDVLVNPPQFRLAPGQKQIVRFGLVSSNLAASPTEGTYRAFLQEVPETPPSGGATLRTLLRISLPVFIAPAGDAVVAGRWSSPGPGVLRYENTGNSHIQFGAMRIVSGERALATIDVGGYVLAGQHHDWKLSGVGALPPGTRVTAESDAGAIDQELGGN